VPAGACSSISVSLARWENRAELYHQSEHVHDDAGFLNPAVLNAVDDHAPHPYQLPRSRHAEELSPVSARPLEAGQHAVTLGELFLDVPVHIRERGPHPSQDILETLETGTLAGEGDVLDHVIPDKPVGGIDPPLVQDLLNKLANNTADLVHRMMASCLSVE